MTAPDVRTDAQREVAALRRVWLAVGNAANPDDFRPSARDRMWDAVVELAEEFATGSRRLYRENQQLEAALATALATPTRRQATLAAQDALGCDIDGLEGFIAGCGEHEVEITEEGMCPNAAAAAAAVLALMNTQTEGENE